MQGVCDAEADRRRDTKGIIIPKDKFKCGGGWKKMIETNVIYYGDNIVEPKTRKFISSPASPEMPIMEISW